MLINRITSRMQQVDPRVTSTDVKAALSQAPLPYGRTIFLYSEGPGGKLRCDGGFPYMSEATLNDGNNSGVELSPASGWRNLLGDLRFDNEAKNSGTFLKP
jgi:hypothetical protein